MLKKMSGNFQKLKRLNNESGSVLVVSYFVITILLGIGAAFLLISVNEIRTAERQRMEVMALHIAEAGIERALYDLKEDYENDSSSPSWNDGTINTYALTADTSNYYSIPYTGTTFNGGSYSVQLKNTSETNEIWVRSTGTIQDLTYTVQAYVKMSNISPWNTAIFAGAGASGTMINGNVDISGSVHVLGTGLDPGDLAMDLGGTANLVRNNYSTLESGLKAKVPALPTVTFGGQSVESLSAYLRVKQGIVGLSGSATVGETNNTSNTVKETVDEVYVTDGWGGNKGSASVYSDNGTSNAYDMGDSISFPLLSDPSPYDPSKSVEQHFKDNALTVTADLSNITPLSAFNYTDGTNYIRMNQAGDPAETLIVNGRIYVSNASTSGHLKLKKSGSDTEITYSGTASVLAAGDIEVNVNLETSGSTSFPTNIMGFMTKNSISMDASGLNVMGLFYAEDTITVAKQTDIVGTIVSNYFDMGTNVPAIYQVPDTVNYLPPGMIGSTGGWKLSVIWQRI